MPESIIQRIERYVQGVMTGAYVANDLRIAHDLKHVDRVRRWALHIARKEGYGNLEIVEAAALLHDIGLAYVKERSQHAAVGAEVAARFLREQELFSAQESAEITEAIRLHSSLPGGGRAGKLAEILKDADVLDALGAVGIMRAFTSKYARPEYDPSNVKGSTWGLTASEFTRRRAAGLGVGEHIMDQVNLQLSLYDDLTTETARRIAEPLVEFMRTYVVQLEAEINARGDPSEAPSTR